MKYLIKAVQLHNGLPVEITTFPEVYESRAQASKEVTPIQLRQGDREHYIIQGKVYDGYGIFLLEEE